MKYSVCQVKRIVSHCHYWNHCHQKSKHHHNDDNNQNELISLVDISHTHYDRHNCSFHISIYIQYSIRNRNQIHRNTTQNPLFSHSHIIQCNPTTFIKVHNIYSFSIKDAKTSTILPNINRNDLKYTRNINPLYPYAINISKTYISMESVPHVTQW